MSVTPMSIHLAQKSQITSMAAYSRLTLVAYEILINFHREREHIWSQPLRASSVLYFMCRYPNFVYQAFVAFYNPKTTPHCDAVYKFVWALGILIPRFATSAVFVLRIHALYQKLWLLDVPLSIIGLTAVSLHLWQLVQISCTHPMANSRTIIITFMFVTAFDVLSTAALLIPVAQIIRSQGSIKRSIDSIGHRSVLHLIVTQGISYFLIVVIVQLGAIVLNFKPQLTYSTSLNSFVLPISTILICRFLLNLKEHRTSSHSMPIANRQPDSVVVFATPPPSAGLSYGGYKSKEIHREVLDDFGESIDSEETIPLDERHFESSQS